MWLLAFHSFSSVLLLFYIESTLPIKSRFHTFPLWAIVLLPYCELQVCASSPMALNRYSRVSMVFAVCWTSPSPPRKLQLHRALSLVCFSVQRVTFQWQELLICQLTEVASPLSLTLTRQSSVQAGHLVELEIQLEAEVGRERVDSRGRVTYRALGSWIRKGRDSGPSSWAAWAGWAEVGTVSSACVQSASVNIIIHSLF